MTTRKITVDIDEDLYQQIDGAGYRLDQNAGYRIELKVPALGDLVWAYGRAYRIRHVSAQTVVAVLHPKEPDDQPPQHEQAELTEDQREHARRAYDNILSIGKWGCLPDGYEYWKTVASRLWRMYYHGTSDGQPLRPQTRWVTPDDEMAKGRPACEVRDLDDQKWKPGVLIAVDSLATGDRFFARLDRASVYWSQCRVLVDAEGKPVG